MDFSTLAMVCGWGFYRINGACTVVARQQNIWDFKFAQTHLCCLYAIENSFF